MVCSRCGFQVLTDEQSDAYTIASADAYRAKHHLLTTQELKQIRERLGMSFRAFARYLKVGEASPKRWEAGLVQDEAMDELIRLKTDLHSARGNAAQLERRLGAAPESRPQLMVVQVSRRESGSEWGARGASRDSREPALPPAYMIDLCTSA
jgi:putative zinc finger/helix-turn-helix YgiT family protein